MDSLQRKKIIIYAALIGATAIFGFFLFALAGNETDTTEKQVNLATSGHSGVTVEDLKQMQNRPASGASVLSNRNQEPGNYEGLISEQQRNIYQENPEGLEDLQNEVRRLSAMKNEKPIQEGTSVAQRIEAEAPAVNIIKGESAPALPQENEAVDVVVSEPEKRIFRPRKEEIKGNSVEAVVHGTQTVSDKGVLKLRLKEDLNLSSGVIATKGTYVSGVVNITEERVFVDIVSVRLGKNIYPVSLSVYDLSGLKGLNVPESVKAELAKRTKSEAIQNTNIQSGAPGITGQVVDGVANTTKSVVSKSMQAIKVEVKSNYEILLKAEKGK